MSEKKYTALPRMALSESSNVCACGAMDMVAFTKTSILSCIQVVSDPPILWKQTGRRPIRLLLLFQSQDKTSGLCWSGEVFVITEALLIWNPLCMMRLLVYMWLSLRICKRVMGKEEQAHMDIVECTVLSSGWTVMSLTGQNLQLTSQYLNMPDVFI